MRISKDSFLINKPIAHRGLWGKDVPENSIKAYELASEKGFPIEIDVYLTTDGQIVSFHDDTLNRMTGEKGFIYNKSYDELSKLRLNNTEYKIPLLSEILKICEGKSGLLIEIKAQPDKRIVSKLLDMLKDYKGEYAIQSFNPMYINEVKKLNPNIIRGILAMENKGNLSIIKHLIVKNMLLNFLIKPDFISYHKNGFPLKKSKTKNKALLAWTVTSKEEQKNLEKYVDNIIFEGYKID